MAVLTGANEDWGCVDGIFLVEQVIESAAISVWAGDVGGRVNDHASFPVVADVAKGSKEDAINEAPQEAKEGKGKGVVLIIGNFGREFWDEGS